MREIQNPPNNKDPLVITPMPNLEDLGKSGAASIDIRLGCWFATSRQTRVSHFDIYDKPDDIPHESKLTKSHFVPFGDKFIIHPKSFVLGITLEWIRLPADRAAFIVGRSTWGRYGLIIATATGVHPGFTGCLALEIANTGEIPITVMPGTTICQIFIHKVESGDPKLVDLSPLLGRRKPALVPIELNVIERKLAEKHP